MVVPVLLLVFVYLRIKGFKVYVGGVWHSCFSHCWIRSFSS